MAKSASQAPVYFSLFLFLFFFLCGVGGMTCSASFSTSVWRQSFLCFFWEVSALPATSSSVAGRLRGEDTGCTVVTVAVGGIFCLFLAGLVRSSTSSLVNYLFLIDIWQSYFLFPHYSKEKDTRLTIQQLFNSTFLL